MRKPPDSPASFRPFFFNSSISKLFERIILLRLVFFLKSNFVFSPRQAGLWQFSFRPEFESRSISLSQFILKGFNNTSRTLGPFLLQSTFLSFSSVWHPALFHKLIWAGLLPRLAGWTQSFLFDCELA